MLPLVGYIGGSLVVAGAMIHTWGTAERPEYKQASQRSTFPAGQPAAVSFSGKAGYLLGVVALTCILYGLGGFPPPSWRLLYTLGPFLFPLWQQGEGLFVALLVAQASCWLFAWILLISMGCGVIFRVVQQLFTGPGKVPTMERWNERSVL